MSFSWFFLLMRKYGIRKVDQLLKCFPSQGVCNRTSNHSLKNIFSTLMYVYNTCEVSVRLSKMLDILRQPSSGCTIQCDQTHVKHIQIWKMDEWCHFTAGKLERAYHLSGHFFTENLADYLSRNGLEEASQRGRAFLKQILERFVLCQTRTSTLFYSRLVSTETFILAIRCFWILFKINPIFLLSMKGKIFKAKF